MNRLKKLIIFCSIFSVTLIGCTPIVQFQRITSGVIGYPPADIQISNANIGYMYPVNTWTAKCNGKTYLCSETNKSINCKELQ